MTHNDIYTKFLIEYDKANVTSSYPALTKYEAATLLDRAYLALIARKVTGNNPRRASLEYDIKAIEDLRPLMVTKALSPATAIDTADNEFVYKLPKKTEMLYFIEGLVDYENTVNAADGMKHKTEIANLADHRTAQKFVATNSNMPWIKQPLVFLEGEDAHLLIDTYKHKNDKLSFYATYLKQFAKFAIGVPEQTTPTEEEPEPTPTPTPSDPTVEPDPIVDPEPTQEEPTVEPQPTQEEPSEDIPEVKPNDKIDVELSTFTLHGTARSGKSWYSVYYKYINNTLSVYFKNNDTGKISESEYYIKSGSEYANIHYKTGVITPAVGDGKKHNVTVRVVSVDDILLSTQITIDVTTVLSSAGYDIDNNYSAQLQIVGYSDSSIDPTKKIVQLRVNLSDEFKKHSSVFIELCYNNENQWKVGWTYHINSPGNVVYLQQYDANKYKMFKANIKSENSSLLASTNELDVTYKSS